MELGMFLTSHTSAKGSSPRRRRARLGFFSAPGGPSAHMLGQRDRITLPKKDEDAAYENEQPSG